jgi:hypothetical protein
MKFINLKNIAVIAIVLFPSFIQAQMLTGRVTDGQSQPVPFASVVLLNMDSTFLSGNVTNDSGIFQIAMSDNAALLKVSCIGYKEKIIPVGAANTDLGEIILAEAFYMLEDVVIKGNLPKTYIKGDAMVTNIAGSVLEKAGSAQEVLANIPGVIRKGDNFNVFGRGAPLFYINNREVRDLSELNQLTSDNIKSVEVISNPGARYAQSVKSVIRIQTKKKENEGWGFSERANLSYNNKTSFDNQANLNYRQNKIDITGMFSYANLSNWRNYDAMLTTYLDHLWEQQMFSKQVADMQRFTGNTTLNYTFNSNHSAGASYRYSRLPESVMNMDLQTDVYQNQSLFEKSMSHINTENPTIRHEGNLYYNGNIGDWSIDFNGTMLWNKDNIRVSTQEDITNVLEGGKLLNKVHTNTDTRNTFYAGKLVLSCPLLGGDLSFGEEYTHTLRTDKYQNEEGIIDNDDSKMNESLTATFAEYIYEIGKIKMQAGLRFENTVFDYYKSGIHQKEQSKDYSNLFPSISIYIPVGNMQTQLSYTSDITRPGYQMLRSRTDYVNRYTYESGNPFLQPSITQNFAITGTYKCWQLYADFQHNKNGIVFSSETYSEENANIALMRQVNIPSYNAINVMLEAAPTIGCWSPQFIFELYKQWYTVPQPGANGNLSLNKPAYATRWRNAIELPLQFTFSADFNWEEITEQTNMSYQSVWWANASLHKDLLNGRLTFLLQANDIFNTFRQNYTVYYGKLRMMDMNQKLSRRSIGLTVQYKFNVLRSKYKGTGAGQAQKERL